MTRRLIVPVAALGLSLALGACGSSASSAGAMPTTAAAPTTTSPAGAANGAQFNAYRDCLSQHGVTLPQPAPGSSAPNGTVGGQSPNGAPNAGGGAGRGLGLNANDPTVQAAMQACASLRPQFNGQAGGGRAGGQGGQQFQAYLSCLEDNGVAAPSTTAPSTPVPTTTPGATGGQAGRQPGGLQGVLAEVRNDPNFATANAKCGVLLPQGGAAPGAMTTTTTAG